MDIARAITLQLPNRIEIGSGTAALVGNWSQNYSRVFVISTASVRTRVAALGLQGNVRIADDIPAEPRDNDLDAALGLAREHQPDLVVGFGGGSVMDIAKLVSVLWDVDQTLADVIGPNKVERKCSALVQVATTAGTGSEGGTRALVTVTETGAKVAVESPHMMADLAVLDPELTTTVPTELTATTGVDALAHCVEAFTNIRAHPLIDGYARMGINLVGEHLVAATREGSDLDARTGMLMASFYGGLCLGPVNTAAGHALAYPLGTHLGLGHGLAVALLFPHVLAFNAVVRPDKTAEVLQAMGLEATGRPASIAQQARDWCESLGITMSLGAHGVETASLRSWAVEAHAIRRLMDNNPRDMSVDDVETIYHAAF